MLKVFFVLQNSANPNIYYKVKSGGYTRGQGHTSILIETNFDGAKKFKSVKEIHTALEKYFNNKIKSQIADMSKGFKIIKHTEQITTKSEDAVVPADLSKLIDDVTLSSKMIKDTHYSTIELFNKIRRDPSLSNYQYILSTAYDRLSTSQLMQLFETHELNPIKYKGNFAFDKEEYWTAAKMICDVPFKSFNLTS